MFFDGSNYGGILDLGSDGAMPSLTGDFYREVDDVTRGLSLYSGADDFGQAHDFMHYGNANLFGKACMGEIETGLRAPANGHGCDLPVSRFQEGDEAMQVPDDSFFQLERTTIVVNGASAAQIGNCMLDFLATDAGASISKVNATKFTIKAVVSIDGLTCMTKIRVYRQAVGQHAVEMQRRSGDSIAFSSLYGWAFQHFNSCMNGAGQAVEADSQPPTFASAPEQTLGAEASVAPLLDLAKSSNEQLQAEAAQGLLQAAADANLVLQICTPQAFAVLRNLLQVACFSIAEPLARVLCCLAALSAAQDNFIDQQLLHPMVGKVWTRTTGQLASEQLARAVCHTISRRVAELSRETSQELTFALTEKLRGGAPDSIIAVSSPQNLATAHYLQESLERLRLFTPLQACY